MLSKQWDVIVGAFSGYCFRWWWLLYQPDNWKSGIRNLVFLIRWLIKARWKGHGLNKSSDGLYTHHDRLIIPRLAQDLCIFLLAECHKMIVHQIDNACWQLCETFFWKERVHLDGSERSFLQLWCLQLFNPIRQGSFALYPLVLRTNPWEIVGMDFVTDFTKSSEFHLTTIINSCLPSEMSWEITATI